MTSVLSNIGFGRATLAAKMGENPLVPDLCLGTLFPVIIWANVRLELGDGNFTCNRSGSEKALKYYGEGGMRTLGTLLRYNALAKRRFRPLSHLTRILRWERYIPAISGVNRNLSQCNSTCTFTLLGGIAEAKSNASTE